MEFSALCYLVEQKINIFEGVLDNNCSKLTTIRDILTKIKEGEWKEEIRYYRNEEDKELRAELKKQFWGVTFSGTFVDKRLDRNLDRYNHILVVDVDLKDLKVKASTARKRLEECPFIFCVFESPSGGLKALAFSRMNKSNHRLFFEGVREYFQYRGIEIDKSGKNPGRLCFISYDPDLYLTHKEKHPFMLERDAPKTFKAEQDRRFQEAQYVQYEKYENSSDLRFIMTTAKKMVNVSIGSYHKGNRNNYVFALACVLNRAGINQNTSIQILFESYPSLGQKEIETTVKSAYKHNSFEHGSRPIMQKKSGQEKLI